MRLAALAAAIALLAPAVGHAGTRPGSPPEICADAAFTDLVGTRGIPTTLVIDRDGRERGRLEGAQAWASDAALAKIRAIMGPGVPAKT